MVSSLVPLLLPLLLSTSATSQSTQSPLVSSPKTYAIQTPPLTTDYTYTVGTDPWTQYPRPQMVRDKWQSLNGIWSYRNASSYEEVEGDVPSGGLEREVLVPSCLEAGLSGIMAPVEPWASAKWSWFQTEFEVSENWKDEEVVLNFGAVDYEATVFVNGHKITTHKGGFDRFWIEIGSQVNYGEKNELVVFVYDPTNGDGEVVPIGKQTLAPEHIFYTPCSGTWQSVWIEPVPKKEYIERIDLSGNMKGVVNITVHSTGSSSHKVHVKVLDEDDKVIASASGASDRHFTFDAPDVKLWSPNDAALYHVSVRLGDDEVMAYTGFRTIEKGQVDGVTRPLLNGEFIFAIGPLDQGYWPDGLLAPPSYEAMISDVKVIKDLGFNMLRKHVKVEPDLFYHACDKMGMLVIQDMPSLPSDARPNEKQQANFKRELTLLIENHRSFPSIYTWVIYNEGWGQLPSAPEAELTPYVKSLDPTRLIDSTTGWHTHGLHVSDYSDNHHYSSPQCGTPFYSIPSSPYNPDQIGFQGEFGGLGHNTSIENLWNVQAAMNTINMTYEIDADLDIWNDRSHDIFAELALQTKKYACSGGVYTQTTDVEGEVNGFRTYDRRILRPDVKQWRKDMQTLYDTAKARGGGLCSASGGYSPSFRGPNASSASSAEQGWWQKFEGAERVFAPLGAGTLFRCWWR